MEGLYDTQECGMAATLCQYPEEAASADKVGGLSQIDEGKLAKLIYLPLVPGLVCADAGFSFPIGAVYPLRLNLHLTAR